MALSPACVAAVGMWDESFWLYSEETDYCLRARDAGFRVRYVPYARAVHLEGDSHADPHLWSTMALNRVRLYRRRHGRLSSASFRGVVVLNEAVRGLAGRRASRTALAALLKPIASVSPGPLRPRPALPPAAESSDRRLAVVVNEVIDDQPCDLFAVGSREKGVIQAGEIFQRETA